MPEDYKFGVTNNLSNREFQLNRTNSPIRYVIVKAWKVPDNIKREDVELLIENIFSDQKYNNCEWYDIELDKFISKITAHFDMLRKMTSGQYFNFVEIDLDNVEGQNEPDQKQERRKSAKLDMEIKIEGQTVEGFTVKEKLGKFINWTLNSNNVDFEKLKNDYSRIIKDNIEDIPGYARSGRYILLDNGYYLNANSDTPEKCNMINKIITEYNLDASCVIL